MRRRQRKQPLLKRLFPHNPTLRIMFAIAVVSSIILIGHSGYHLYQIKAQEQTLMQEKQKLLEERQQLEEQKAALNSKEVIEKKAREDLGMVKPGEVPYVK